MSELNPGVAPLESPGPMPMNDLDMCRCGHARGLHKPIPRCGVALCSCWMFEKTTAQTATPVETQEEKLRIDERETMNSEQIHEALLAADRLSGACRYLAKQFSLEMTRDEAQANVSSRTILSNLGSAVLDDAYDLSGLTEAGDHVRLHVVRKILR